MNDFPLLVVEDSFEVTGRGLLLAPSLHAPPGCNFPFAAKVDVSLPDGNRLAAVAVFSVEMGGRSSKSACVVLLREMTKSEVPIGSRILVDEGMATNFTKCK